MQRACKVTLKFVTQKKRKKINALLESYRAAVNFYIRSLWKKRGKLDKETLERLKNTRLSERYKSNALRQALNIIVSTKLSLKEIKPKKTVAAPIFKGAVPLDAKFVTIEDGKGSFDLVVKISSLHKGHRITIPTQKTRILNKWLSKPRAKLVQGCGLSEDKLIVWVELPNYAPKKKGKILGIDIGVNKLLVDSDNNQYGTDFKKIRDKIIRRKKGSKGRKRAYKERNNYIGQVLNQLPWSNIRAIGVEDLKDLKKGKKKDRSRAFRKAMTPWTYRQVLNRIENKAQENRVCFVSVDPANTSRTCPLCDTVSKNNRRGENFECIVCGYKEDADYVGAFNILTRTLRFLGSIKSPRLQKVM